MYKPRIADRLLTRKIAGKGAVLIEGASPTWHHGIILNFQVITLKVFPNMVAAEFASSLPHH